MVIKSNPILNENTTDQLQKLIRANIDSADGFREAAEAIDDPHLTSLFYDLSTQRSNFANELQNYVEWQGLEAEDDGSFAAQVHRVWINVRGLLSGGDAYAILAEAERGEDHIKHAYEEVMKETAGCAVNDVLLSQYSKVKACHDLIRDLRDNFKNKS